MTVYAAFRLLKAGFSCFKVKAGNTSCRATREISFTKRESSIYIKGWLTFVCLFVCSQVL